MAYDPNDYAAQERADFAQETIRAIDALEHSPQWAAMMKLLNECGDDETIYCESLQERLIELRISIEDWIT